MIKVENIDVWGFEHAIRGIHSTMNCLDTSDSGWCYANSRVESKCDAMCCDDCVSHFYEVGKNDIALMRRLYKAGPEHRKYLRQICMSMDITAPLYWWKEHDQYNVWATSNSCNTLHKIHAKEFTIEDFSFDKLLNNGCDLFNIQWENGLFDRNVQPMEFLHVWIINALNVCRAKYLETRDKDDWGQMIQLLPSSYNEKRTVTMNYENVVNVIDNSSGTKFYEWNEFFRILKNLPYVKEITEQ